MERIIQAEKDDELKKAYGEMLEGCLTHPDQWDWYAIADGYLLAKVYRLLEEEIKSFTGGKA